MSVRSSPHSRVMLHADDFGMNDAVNHGILISFREGLLTSTSLLANAPAAEAACQAWPELIAAQAAFRLKSSGTRATLGDPVLPFDLGIHLNLTQGRPLTGDKYPAEMLDREGCFPGIGAVFSRLKRMSTDGLDRISRELRAQIEWMCDRGLRPTHLNGHQYVELMPAVAALLPAILKQYSIPVVRVARETGLLRSVLASGRVAAWGLGQVKRFYAGEFQRLVQQTGIAYPDHFFGTSHAGLVNQRVFETFFPKSFRVNCTEIGLHPGVEVVAGAPAESDPWFDPLAGLRPAECTWLCNRELIEFLQMRGIQLGRLSSLSHCG